MAVLLLLLLVMFNGVLVMGEIAVLSARKARLRASAQRGSAGAAAALALAESPTRFLSTVQLWITLIAIFSGAYGEAALTDGLNDWLVVAAPGLGTWSRSASFAIVVTLIALVSLVIGELIPKRLALAAPEAIATALVGPVRWLSLLVAPIAAALSATTDVLLRPFLGPEGKPDLVTEEEIRTMIQQGAQSGVFHEDERRLVESVFQLADQRVKSLMVPRTQIEWLNLNAPPQRVRLVVATSAHSHFPVCRGGLDDLVGVVHVEDLVKHGLVSGNTFDLAALAQPPIFVPETMPALRLLATFREKRQHIAFVLDEHGAVEGLVTLSDLIEAIVGQVARRNEPDDPMVVRRHDGSLLLDGMLPVAQLKPLLRLATLPKEDQSAFETLGGFVMASLGRVPRAGDRFNIGGSTLEVVDMDGRRVDKVLLYPAKPKISGPPSRRIG